MTKKTLREQILDADVKCSMCLADANQAGEHGDKVKAEMLYERSQRWLDKRIALEEKMLLKGLAGC